MTDLKKKFRCCCGHSYTHHCGNGADVQSFPNSAAAEHERESWSPGKNTRSSATDAYGTIEFQGLPHPTKAQVRPKLITPYCSL